MKYIDSKLFEMELSTIPLYPIQVDLYHTVQMQKCEWAYVPNGK